MFEYEYPRPAVSADVMVVDQSSEPNTILLIKRLKDPHKDCWALPGGFMEIDETLEQAAIRELAEETSLIVETVRQIASYSAIDRDPRTRVITTAFLAMRPKDQQAVAADDAKEASWCPINDLPELAFDHQAIIDDGLKLLRRPE